MVEPTLVTTKEMQVEMDDVIIKQKKKYKIPGVRFLFAFAGFLGFAVNYAVRSNLNVAIVAMVNSTAVYHTNDNRSTSNECKPLPTEVYSDTGALVPEITKMGEFLWSPQEQGIILGAFYYGYCILQIPSGRLADMYSGKWVFGLGTFIPVLLTLLTPLAAHLHIGALISLRVLEGLTQGAMFPALYSLMSRWFPDSERGFLLGLMMAGISGGTLASMTATGFLCNSDSLGGWPSAFYVIGALGCLWFLFWCLLITDSPSSHPLITEKELKYIISNQRTDPKVVVPPFPWLKVMTSIPFWALVIAQVGGDWGFFVMFSNLPTFFATILHFEIEKNGFLSSFPYMLKTLVFIVVGYVCDVAIRRNFATVKHIRIFCTIMSHLVASIFLVGVCFAGCDVTMCVTFLMLFVSFYGFNGSGISLSFLDISPEYSGTLMGIANSISSLTGFLVPLMVGTLTDTNQTLHQWRLVFGISAAIQASAGVIFICFSSSEKQNWVVHKSL